jgi:cytochrome c-type biogenesis protein CcmH/NrfF
LISTTVLAWPTPIALALLGGMIALAMRRARAQPLLAFGIGWFSAASRDQQRASARRSAERESNGIGVD